MLKGGTEPPFILDLWDYSVLYVLHGNLGAFLRKLRPIDTSAALQVLLLLNLHSDTPHKMAVFCGSLDTVNSSAISLSKIPLA